MIQTSKNLTENCVNIELADYSSQQSLPAGYLFNSEAVCKNIAVNLTALCKQCRWVSKLTKQVKIFDRAGSRSTKHFVGFSVNFLKILDRLLV